MTNTREDTTRERNTLLEAARRLVEPEITRVLETIEAIDRACARRETTAASADR